MVSPFGAMSNDILDRILKTTSQKDVVQFSSTCTALRSHPIVLRHIYTEPINKNNLPLSNYGAYCISHKSRFDFIIHGIYGYTGLFVRRMAMHQWLSLDELRHLDQHCPNLDTVDFSGIFEPVDYLNYRQTVASRPPCTHVPGSKRFRPSCANCTKPFRWAIMLERCPQFFHKLKSLTIKHGIAWSNDTRPVDGGQQTRTQLRLLLDLCPQLETLRLVGTSLENHFHTARRMEKLQTTITSTVGHTLKRLGLSSNPETNPSKLNLILKGFNFLHNNGQVFELSLHQDLQKHEGAFRKSYLYGSLQFEKDRQGTSVVKYITNAKTAFENANWEFVSSDSGDHYPSRPATYYELLDPDNRPCLEFLVKNLHWTPLFTWGRYILNYSSWAGWDVEENPNAVGHMDWPPKYDFQDCRKLFRRLQRLKTPVRLLLTPGKWDHGAFFWYDRWAKGQEINARCVKFIERHREFLKLSKAEYNKVHKPAQGHFATNELDFYHRSHQFDATDWGLYEVGDLVDDLQIIWTDAFGLSGGSEVDGLEIENQYEGCNFSRRGENILPLRLAHEAKRIAPLFKFLARDFPSLKRLALYIPAALYPDHDQLFIDKLLPGNGSGWMVHHSGSGGGSEANKVSEKYFDWNCQPTDRANAEFNDAYDVLPESDAQKEADLARCPMIHRVFTRRRGVNKTSALDHEVYTTQRPPVDLRSPNILELILNHPNYDPNYDCGSGGMRETSAETT